MNVGDLNGLDGFSPLQGPLMGATVARAARKPLGGRNVSARNASQRSNANRTFVRFEAGLPGAAECTLRRNPLKGTLGRAPGAAAHSQSPRGSVPLSPLPPPTGSLRLLFIPCAWALTSMGNPSIPSFLPPRPVSVSERPLGPLMERGGVRRVILPFALGKAAGFPARCCRHPPSDPEQPAAE